MKTISNIKDKYSWLDKNVLNYGSSFHAKKFLNFLLSLNVSSVLDIGTGRGEFCDWALTNLCDTVYGLDFAINPNKDYANKNIKFINSPAHKIPLKDNSVDLITSFDVLEHIPPSEIEETIFEMSRVAKKLLFHKICYNKGTSKFKKEVGELHLIQEDSKYWINIFKQGINIKDIFSIKGGIFIIL